MIDLSIIIVNWNTCDHLYRCLHSIQNGTFDLTYEIIVVDNASQDNSIDMIVKEFPNIRIISNSENHGYAAANNQGIDIASGEYLLLLNPDTEIPNQTLERMVAYLNCHSEVGAIGPRLTLKDGTIQGGAAGFDPSPSTIFNYAFMLHALFPKYFRGIWLTEKHYQLSQDIDVDWVAGACLMLRALIIKQVGKMNPDIFMYAEDIEFCHRIKKAGWKIHCLSEISIIHYIGGSTKQKGWKFISQNITGLDFYYRSRFDKRKVALMHLWSAFGFIFRAILYRLMLRSKKDIKYTEMMLTMQQCARSSFHYMLQSMNPSK